MQINELKKKAEQRLTQIKKTFGGQLEEKLSKIGELSEKNSSLESEIVALKEKGNAEENDAVKELEIEKLKLEEKISGLESSVQEVGLDICVFQWED